MVSNLINEISKLDFIESVFPDTIEYRTETDNAPGYWTKDREYEKINIRDTKKGITWLYRSSLEVDDIEELSDFELYFIVNTKRAKLSLSEVVEEVKKTVNSSGRNFTIELDAERALSRYSNFFETNKQIGKIPYVVFRVDFSDTNDFCI